MTQHDTAPANPAGPDDLLSIREAVSLYHVGHRVLEQRLRIGDLRGTKVKAVRTYEWRVRATTLDAAGYRRRERPLPAEFDRGDVRRRLARLADLVAAAQAGDGQGCPDLAVISTELTALRELV